MFRAVHSGLALRPRPAPTFCPALWVADLKGGFWKEAFAFRAQAPVPAFWPCVPALTTRSSRPGSSHSALRRPRTSTHAPRLALRSYTPAPCSGRDGSCASSPHSGPRAPTQTCPHILPRALGGGFEGRILEGGFRVPGSSSGPRVLALCSGPHNPVLAPRLLAFRPASAPHSGSAPRSSHSAPLHLGFALRLPHFVPRSRPRAPAPAFPPRISGGGFEGGFSGNILERRIPGGCFEGGGLRSGSCVRPRRCVSELRILANRQNKVYL